MVWSEPNRPGMTDFDFRHPAVLFASVLAAIVTAFLLIAALSPQVGVDIPGVRRCDAIGCGSGGD